jgi:hypothetical protein
MGAMLFDAPRDQDCGPPTQCFLGLGLSHVGEKHLIQRQFAVILLVSKPPGTRRLRRGSVTTGLRKRLFRG